MRSSVATHIDTIQRAITSSDAARSALVASWRRSGHLHALDPAARVLPKRLTDDRTVEARQRIEPIVLIAQAALDRLFKAVGGVGCSVMLADSGGLVIDRRGAPGDDATFRDWGLWTGSIWSEKDEGTNGIGTCLFERRPLTVHRDQHFFARNAALSCSAAPIFDEHGELAAAIDVSSCRADLTEGFSNLIATAVTDAARQVETDNFRAAFANARIVLAETHERLGVALVAVDADDLVLGATRAARGAFGISPGKLARSTPFADLTGAGPKTDEGLASAERAVLQRALARSRGNVSRAAEALGISRATLHRKLNQFGLKRAS